MKQALCIYLFLTYILCKAGDLVPQKPIKIDSPIINLINGTSLIDIESIINFRLKLREFNLGIPKKLCSYKGVEYSVHELGLLEDLPTADQEELKQTRDNAITLFEKFSEPHLKEAQASRHFTVKIIAKWLEQRGRPQSHLGEWSRHSAAEERALFRKEMVTFKKIDEFCDDLTLFLLDLIYSCDKSYQKYREKKAAENAGKKSESGEHFEAIDDTAS